MRCCGFRLLFVLHRGDKSLQERISLTGHHVSPFNFLGSVHVLFFHCRIAEIAQKWCLAQVFPRVFVVKWVWRLWAFQIVVDKPKKSSRTIYGGQIPG